MVQENSLDSAVKNALGSGTRIEKRVPVSGGDINRAYALHLSDGSMLFLKENSRNNSDFFRAEAEGLEAIRATKTLRAPRVIARGTDGDSSFLLLEYIDSGRGGRRSSEELGHGLAAMHLADTERFVPGGRFGFARDNYIGAGVQLNKPEGTWTEFFVRQRLMPQLERARSYFSKEERLEAEKFIGRLDRYITEPDHPSLLHGDLWAGNYMIGTGGEHWLIDPAVYVGHAEADLAMTELFGGFDRTFYDAYRESAGIDPGYRDRRDIYNLYHLLNHLNLFGGSYLYSVRSVIRRYV